MVPRGLRVGLLRVWGHCSAWSGVIGGVALVAITLIHSADTRHVLQEKRERAHTNSLERASESSRFKRRSCQSDHHAPSSRNGLLQLRSKEHSVGGRAQESQFYSQARIRRHSHDTRKPRTHSAAPPGAGPSTLASTHARQERAPRHHPYRGQNT